MAELGEVAKVSCVTAMLLLPRWVWVIMVRCTISTVHPVPYVPTIVPGAYYE